MLRILAIAAAVGSLAACAPSPTPAPAPAPAPAQTADAAACTARGGALKQVGRMQSWQCVVPYADAGKACTDGDQCQGDCRVEGATGLADGAPVTGVCQATSDNFGCHTRVEDGKAGPTLCID